MANLKSIKKRIVSVKNTRQITKAMKMVSAAKLRRAQENVVAARPYAKKLGEVLQRLARARKATAIRCWKSVKPKKRSWLWSLLTGVCAVASTPTSARLPSALSRRNKADYTEHISV